MLERDGTKTTGSGFVNYAYRNDNESKEPTSALSNVNHNLYIDKPIAIQLDDVITNNRANDNSHTNEIKREAINDFEYELVNSVCETATTVNNDAAVGDNADEGNGVFDDDTGVCICNQTLVGDFNRTNFDDDEDRFSTSGWAFKRSHSFGDRPKRRKPVG